MSLSNKIVAINKSKKSSLREDSISKKDALCLKINRHNSLLDLVTYHNDVLDDFSPYVMDIIQAESLVNKNLAAFLYSCAINKKNHIKDFERLNLNELDINVGDLFQELAYSTNGYQKIGALKLRIADFNGEVNTSEIKNVMMLMQKYRIGTRFKQDTISEIETTTLPNNVITLS